MITSPKPFHISERILWQERHEIILALPQSASTPLFPFRLPRTRHRKGISCSLGRSLPSVREMTWEKKRWEIRAVGLRKVNCPGYSVNVCMKTPGRPDRRDFCSVAVQRTTNSRVAVFEVRRPSESARNSFDMRVVGKTEGIGLGFSPLGPHNQSAYVYFPTAKKH